MMRILLTNDDGIHSDGIIKLEQALKPLGDLYVVAPASEMSGASHSLTLNRPLRIRQFDSRHWAIDGTPTDCVTLALYQILKPEEHPHICVSGINHGANLGDDASYSGTVAGALEATILGVPGLALSLESSDSFDFAPAAEFAAIAARRVLSEGLPEATLLNINVPARPIQGVRVTKLGITATKPVISEHVDPRGKKYYWIGQRLFRSTHEEGTDYHAIQSGYVSITPMRSDMTSYPTIETLSGWNT
jgi:5'-nucleotidase